MNQIMHDIMYLKITAPVTQFIKPSSWSNLSFVQGVTRDCQTAISPGSISLNRSA